MNEFIRNSFNLLDDYENLRASIKQIKDDIHLRGANLIILIIAIIICSVGLNINSIPAIIGAMLISPIMKPIIGFGLSLGIYDTSLLKSSIKNIVFAVVLSIFTSTLYFLISPIDIAYSEILARTNPNIYDVIIAFFGGAAAIITIFTNQKGTVIPGAAIATALLPPLCTVGFGLANQSLKISIGAFYLFTINLVFISLSALLVTKTLPLAKHIPQKESLDRFKRLIISLSIIFLIIPSLYFAYESAKENKYNKTFNQFTKNEITFKNAYILKKDIDIKNKKITIVYGGEKVDDKTLTRIKNSLASYGLDSFTLNIQEGFTYLNTSSDIKKISELQKIIASQSDEINELKKIDTGKEDADISSLVLENFPSIDYLVISRENEFYRESNLKKVNIVFVSKAKISSPDKENISTFLKENFPNLIIITEYKNSLRAVF